MQRVLGVGSIDFDTAGTNESDSEFVFAGIVDPNGLRRRIDTEYRRRMEEQLGDPDPQTGAGDPTPMH